MSEKVKLEGQFEEGTFGEWLSAVIGKGSGWGQLLSGIIDRSSCWGQLLVVWVLFSQEGYIKDWVVEVGGDSEEGGLGT